MPLNLSLATYSIAAHLPRQWPPDVGAEAAFAGRSNVGKSSALNAITRRAKLARVSKTPGRTRQIVFFNLDESRRLVDLPGYGYAKAPRDLRLHWQKLTGDYLTSRRSLRGLVVPMDIRHPLTALDEVMLACAREIDLPVHILLTKADKLKRGPAMNALQQVRAKVGGPAVTVQLFSALRKSGVEEAEEVLRGWLGDVSAENNNRRHSRTAGK